MDMETKSLQPIIEKLEDLFSVLNKHFYDGELQAPVITISPDVKNNAYGWCSTYRAWTTKEPSPTGVTTPEEARNEGYYEINICSEYLSRTIEETIATMLHEMAHLYNLQNNMKDFTRGGYYHNKVFADTASAHGLTVTKTKKYGYSYTTLNDEAKDFIVSLDLERFDLHRRKAPPTEAKSRKAHSIKYTCPKCGTVIRATKDIRAICKDCNAEFEKEKTEEEESQTAQAGDSAAAGSETSENSATEAN